MIIEGIRNLLGEDLAKQVEAALKGKGQGRKGRRPGDRERRDLRSGRKDTTVPTAGRPVRKTP